MFKVISQTNDFVVIAKNADVNFHDEGIPGSGLFSKVKEYILGEDSSQELYPIHRLDKMTSGLLVFAKNNISAKIFGELFEKHQVEKYYLAISDTKPTKKQGLIKGDMAKSRRGMFKLMRTQKNPAITQFFSYSMENKQRLYLLKPHSGKTHQLRVALSSIGAPIIGDPLYSTNSKTHSKVPADRGYLHAYALRFEFLGEPYEFIFPPDEGDFFQAGCLADMLEQLNKPWLLNWPKL
ncbi:TIGR01621 family pseudouridine synthase [Colwellia sp. 6_MG-2023]|uniref:TIGR01621 family pseudouridine synthase n=1 Tax=Colwellia sp. 6_MG-2023 TaxID=3062676 RepID=UPI0026E3BC5A|nr:TIGR01621 family pseudouridine synthase [Colwellia sp. 6_MG-2023]MDO6488191.1 TIGR01621 family pseudouridine synthase [Colwellia sp. 6_MG-2023]